jgi:hypothetical protein
MAEVAVAAVIIAATQGTRPSSLQHGSAFRQLEQARAASPAVRAYLLFPPPLRTAEPSHAWKPRTVAGTGRASQGKPSGADIPGAATARRRHPSAGEC